MKPLEKVNFNKKLVFKPLVHSYRTVTIPTSLMNSIMKGFKMYALISSNWEIKDWFKMAMHAFKLEKSLNRNLIIYIFIPVLATYI